MDEREWLAAHFEEHRSHLQGVAYRMLGSLSDAEDAVQETWLRLSRADTNEVANLGGWLTTVTARICLDMLRARKSRREESLEAAAFEPVMGRTANAKVDPEQEALLADSVGLALLVVLETLTPAERLAFVLHDIFAVPFHEIAPILDRSPDAARQLASRARRRVQGENRAAEFHLSEQREVVNAFLAAAREGDFHALLEVLAPDVLLRTVRAGANAEAEWEIHGAEAVAKQAMQARARAAQAALVDGTVGVIIAPHGRLLMVLLFTVAQGKILAIDAIEDPARLRELDLAVLND